MIASGAAPRVDLCALAAAGFGSKLVSSHVPELVALNTQLSALASVALATDVSVSRCYCILSDTSIDSCDERCSSPTGACRIGSFVRISRSGSRDLSSTIPWCCPFFCRKAALDFARVHASSRAYRCVFWLSDTFSSRFIAAANTIIFPYGELPPFQTLMSSGETQCTEPG